MKGCHLISKLRVPLHIRPLETKSHSIPRLKRRNLYNPSYTPSTLKRKASQFRD